MKLITTTGYGTTGSSVVTDLLKEFDNVKSFGEHEFRWLFDVHGVRELEVALLKLNNRQNSDYYLKAFKKHIEYLSKSPVYSYYEKTFNGKFLKLSLEYIEDLADVKWQGYWHQDIMNESMIRKMFFYAERIFQKKVLKQKDSSAKFYKKDMYYTFLTQDDFLKKTKNYINNLLNEIKAGEEFLVFDQLVPPENTAEFLKYFDYLKIIIVDRDPRDLYLLEKYEYNETWVPFDDIDTYIKWYRLLREHRKKDKDNSNVLYVHFEDFIYRYDDTINKILDFIGIDKLAWIEPKKYFNPDISIKNTKKWFVYPQAKKEVEMIKKELPEFLVEY